MYWEVGIFILYLVISLLSVHFVRKLNLKRGVKGIDINKPSQPILPESCGIALLIPLTVNGLFMTYWFSQWELLAWPVLMAVFAFIGYLDDSKHKFTSKAVGWIVRALPIALVSLAFSYVFGLGILWTVPLALYIAGLASFQNTFAGLNGWEVGSGFIISLASVVLLWGTFYQLAAIAFSASILGLLLWNRYPAKVFPGDSGTLLIGSGLAGLFVLTSRLEFIFFSFLFYIPHLIDFFLLKLLSNRKDLSQQKFRPYKLLENGKLAIPDYPDKKIRYDFAKLVIRLFGPMNEWLIVLIIWLVVLVNCLFVLHLAGFRFF